MANTKSAMKRMRQNERRRLRTRAVRSKVRSAIKIARSGEGPEPRASIADAIRILDKPDHAALFGPGDWTRLGPHLTTPHHRVHWAGTETSTEFFGLMEGAIRSGHRAAADILTDNRRTTS